MQLLEPFEAELLCKADGVIEHLAYDSRQVTNGSLFVALEGAQSDGHDYLERAVKAGARALLIARSGKLPEHLPSGVGVVRVADTRRLLPRLSARFFEHPARGMTLIGVTGTNGKTSTVRLVEAILASSGRKAGSLGTISNRFAGREEPASLTTPESVDLHATLRRMADAGVDHAALEVSSHSLEAGRVETLRFAAAAFTNLTQDHLDFHGDMQSYARAKRRLFEPELLHGTAVLPLADPLTSTLREAAETGGHPCLTYARESRHAGADVRSLDEQVELGCARFVLATPDGRAPVELPLAGDFQIDNALAAAACASAIGLSAPEIAHGLSQCPPVPGRLERVSDLHPLTFVDYAHTPDALDQVLQRMRPFVGGRLICVFGCGGDRDRSKRAPMARAACAHSDVVIATSDNPRTEDPGAILRDVAAGLSGDSQIIQDRRSAIAKAIDLAGEGDVVLIAGKGHETYQIVGRERFAFDDREVARESLVARRSRA